MKPILSLNDLSSRLGIPRATLATIAANAARSYRSWQKLYKRTGKIRTLREPSKELKEAQRRIARNVLLQIEIPAHVHGGVKGCSPRTNATPHLRRKWVASLDVRDFFPQIRHGVILRLFRKELGFGRDVSRLLTRLTTFDGGLPQGAPTSLALANIILWTPVDMPIAEEAATLDLRITRWVDDISVSGDDPRPIINSVAKRLSQRGLRMYRAKARFQTKPKLKIVPRNQRQEVTGLVVNGKHPTVSRPRRDRVRAAIHQLNKLQGGEFAKEAESIQGRINHISQFHPQAVGRLEAAFRRVQEARK
ncbi:MAG: reverse transcriptase family protein [Pseudomonadota bacterium]|nr:reverse transcriptase family protein [Pseudomonadota bacterium]